MVDTQWAYLVGIRVRDCYRSAGAVVCDQIDDLGFRPEQEGLPPETGWQPGGRGQAKQEGRVSPTRSKPTDSQVARIYSTMILVFGFAKAKRPSAPVSRKLVQTWETLVC